MRSQRVMELGLGLLSVFVMTISAAAQDKEPTYRGRTLSQWAARAAMKDADVADRGIRALTKLGPQVKNAVPALIHVIRTNALDAQERCGPAIAALKAIGADGVPALREALIAEGLTGPGAVNFIVFIARALGEIGPGAKAAIPELIGLLKNPPSFGGFGDGDAISRAAGAALEKIGPAAVPALLEVLKDAKARWIHRRANDALLKMKLGTETDAAVPALIDALKDKDAELREKAALLLGRIGPRAVAAVPALQGALGNKNETIRVAAAVAMGRIGPAAKAAIPALSDGLKDATITAQIKAARAVLGIDLRHSDALAVLAAVLQDKMGARGDRIEAVMVLAEIGTDDKATAAALAGVLKDPEETIRSAAALALLRVDRRHQAARTVLKSASSNFASEAIRRLPAATVPILSDCLKDNDRDLRLRAVKFLSGFDREDRAASNALTEAMKDEDQAVRREAIWTLVDRGVRSPEMAAIVPDLLRALNQPDSTNHFIPPGPVLVELGPIAAPALLDALKDEEFTRRDKVATTLGQIDGGPKTVTALLDALKPATVAQPYEVRTGVIRGLAEIGPEAKTAIPALIAILRDKREGNLRIEAAKALGEIGGDKTVVAALTEALKDVSTLRAGLKGLVLLGLSSAPILLDMFKNQEDVAKSCMAAEALGELGAVGVPALIEALKDNDTLKRTAVISALGRLGPQARAAVPALVEVYKKDSTTSFAAGVVLKGIDPEAAKKAGVP